jgi:class 3 adenylate cyclase
VDSNVQRVRTLLSFLWPDLALAGSKWESEWNNAQSDRFTKTARIFFGLAAIGYLGHYFLIDIPNKKEPIELWFLFRMSITALCLCTLFLFLTSYARKRWAKWVAAFVMALGCHAQAHVVLNYPDAPWIYPFVFTLCAALLLQYPPLKSLIFSTPLMASFFPPLLAANVAVDQLMSATFLTSLVIFVTRSAYIFELRAFLLTQERDESRQQVIELGRDYESRLKSFIPKVIADRLQQKIVDEGQSPLQATVNVLSARKQTVACLFSDIRGFTQNSKDMDTFLLDSALPEVKACSDAIEAHQGIPRKIGDLIFAYFDDHDDRLNLIRSLLAGLELSRLNRDLNYTNSSINVRRYILISVGDAIVGNVGGLNSGVEITALGPPVNFLSRLDDATKEPLLADKLVEGDLIVSKETANLLEKYEINIPLKKVAFGPSDFAIRDFSEVREVFIIHPDDTMVSNLSSHLTAAK